ncbi:cupin domain-containing protein [Mucilaginibacter terrigena]|uniref:Cupin domain-containing protein n=1 Tax=Mucilaginibacter terrigena TaxID=2492395 RepID=A0A4Q5LIL9_9SPHI|nr:cupin domain-containing protein [Mucilaginibacter terrigena]RYU89251.1 cupin domain-containing protein [Mucilaginibacter terrigena]
MISTRNFKQQGPSESREIKGVRTSVILSTECSGGNLTIIEEEVNVGAGSPPHICNGEDKVILVTNGNFMLFADGKKYEAAKGANIYIPHGTIHSIKNVGTQTGILLVTLTPGGQKSLLKPQSQTVKVFGKNTAAVQDVAKKYNVVFE